VLSCECVLAIVLYDREGEVVKEDYGASDEGVLFHHLRVLTPSRFKLDMHCTGAAAANLASSISIIIIIIIMAQRTRARNRGCASLVTLIQFHPRAPRRS